MLRQILKIVNGRPAFAMQVKINGIFPFAHPLQVRRFISLGEWEYKITAGDSYFISLDTGLDSHLTRLDYPKKGGGATLQSAENFAYYNYAKVRAPSHLVFRRRLFIF